MTVILQVYFKHQKIQAMRTNNFCFNFITQHSFFYPKSVVNSALSVTLIGLLLFISLSCETSDDEVVISDLEKAEMVFTDLLQDPENTSVLFPEEDPGIPIYARVGPILNQFFVTDDQLVIPFYRDPQCVSDNFNLLNYYDPPAAFGCELTVEGRFVIEKEAEAGDFPIMVHTVGNQVPIWVVNWPDFQMQMESGSVTMADLKAMNPTIGMADSFDEFLSPRMSDHQVIIEASGAILDTNEAFTFRLTHRADKIESISLEVN